MLPRMLPLKRWDARGLAGGCPGALVPWCPTLVENPLFFDPKTRDGCSATPKASIVVVTDELNALGMPAAGDTVGAAQASS